MEFACHPESHQLGTNVAFHVMQPLVIGLVIVWLFSRSQTLASARAHSPQPANIIHALLFVALVQAKENLSHWKVLCVQQPSYTQSICNNPQPYILCIMHRIYRPVVWIWSGLCVRIGNGYEPCLRYQRIIRGFFSISSNSIFKWTKLFEFKIGAARSM